MNFTNSAGQQVASFNRPSSASVWGCDGDLPAPNDLVVGPISRTLCAALNRGTLGTIDTQPSLNAAEFYRNNPTNQYARIIHANMVDGKAYAFAFDDVGAFESLVHDGDPRSAGIILSPFAGGRLRLRPPPPGPISPTTLVQRRQQEQRQVCRRARRRDRERHRDPAVHLQQHLRAAVPVPAHEQRVRAGQQPQQQRPGLDVNRVSTADNAVVHLWAYGGGNNQQWLPVVRRRRLLPLREPAQRQVPRRSRPVHGRQRSAGAVHVQRNRGAVLPAGGTALSVDQPRAKRRAALPTCTNRGSAARLTIPSGRMACYVEERTTSSVGRMSASSIRSPSMIRTSWRARSRPSSTTGWRTVDSGGSA